MWKVFVLLSIVVCVHGLCKLTGVNQAGAEFGDKPGVLGKDYIYPTTSADYFVGKKMNVIRLPFLWERVIRTKGANFTAVDINSYVSSVNYMTRSAYVIIDPHNYGRGYGGLVGQSATTIQDFVNFWIKLATLFKNNRRVIFGLMNEPHDNNIWIWRSACQAAVNGIRSTGATQLILVPGIAYTGAGSWISSKNSEVMWDIQDPKNNYAYEVHQYFDQYSTGTTTQCVSATFGADKLKAFTEWARTYNKMGFLGEFGAASSPDCLEAIKNMLSYMSKNNDVWLGWTYWAGGPWWGEHFMTLQPNATVANRAQWAAVAPYLAKSVPSSLVVGKTTPPGPVYVAIYKDSFWNSYGDWGWAPRNNNYTAFKRSGASSISFTTGSGKSLCYVCYGCVNSTSYTYIQFWIYLTTGSTDGISVSMVNVVNNSPKAVAPSVKLTTLLTRSFLAKTWLQVTVPLANWASAEAFDGFILSGSGGATGQVGYLDDIFAVRYVYGSSPAKREATNDDVAADDVAVGDA